MRKKEIPYAQDALVHCTEFEFGIGVRHRVRGLF
jgi:hypothetical protein